MKFALFFALVLVVFKVVQDHYPEQGPLVVAGLAGLSDVDAVTLSMAKFARAGGSAETATAAIVIASLSNTLVKCALAAGPRLGRAAPARARRHGGDPRRGRRRPAAPVALAGCAVETGRGAVAALRSPRRGPRGLPAGGGRLPPCAPRSRPQGATTRRAGSRTGSRSASSRRIASRTFRPCSPRCAARRSADGPPSAGSRTRRPRPSTRRWSCGRRGRSRSPGSRSSRGGARRRAGGRRRPAGLHAGVERGAGTRALP